MAAPLMRRWLALCLLSALGAAEVTDLVDGTFEAVVGAPEHWLVAFTAPWCGHCKKLKEPWAAAADTLDGKVRFGAVDATKQRQLAKRFDVKGYPTIKYFHDGRVRDYKGPRTQAGFEAYAERVTSAPVSRAASIADVRATLGTTGRAFVLARGSEASGAPSPLPAAFAAVAAELHDELRFFELAGADGGAAAREMRALGAGAAGGEGGPVVAVLDGARWGEPMPPLTPEPDAEAPADAAAVDAVRAWVSERAEARVLGAGSHNLYDLKRCGRRVALGVLDGQAEGAEAQRAQLAAHADAFDAHFRFAWINGRDRPDYWALQYGITPEGMPTLLVLEARTAEQEDERHWVALNGTAPLVRADEQAAFLRAIVAGELESVKSGESGGVLGTLLSVVRMLKGFALEYPLYFFGCCALNVVFLVALCATSTGAAVDPAATVARASAPGPRTKSAKAE